MFRFESPIYLWLLLIVPLLAVVRFFVWRMKRAQLRRFGDIQLLKQLMPTVSNKRTLLKYVLLLAAIVCIIIALARPQMGSKISKEKRNGIETMICLDISNSMKATDVTPSRLDKSKLMIENLVDHFTNDKIGLVVFAGEAYIQLPITSDYVSAKMFLQSVQPTLIGTQGTDIASAINIAMNSFTSDKAIGKAIILITDGEDHEGAATEAAKQAYKEGVNVYILGVGTPQGAPIPDADGSYMRDRSGEIVVSKLNEDMCREIAQAGKGTYIHVNNTNTAQEQLNSELTKLQKGETESVIYSEYEEQFQTFVILALLLLFAEMAVLSIKNPLFQRIHIFKKKD